MNFVDYSHSDQSMFVRTFERGVDAETLSCGSGVTASVISIAEKYGSNQNTYNVHTKGGTLLVNRSNGGDKFYLEGPVQVIYKGIYIEEENS